VHVARPTSSSAASHRRGRRASRLRALRLIHPFPTTLNAVAAVLLALVAERGSPGPAVAARLAATMFVAQSAIGIVNDIVDRELDAHTKPWKPIPAGAVTVRTARWLGAGAATAALLLGATFGPAAWALSTAGMGVGLAYDLWLKRSALSGLTYAVALPLVPLWVWTALGRFTPALLWVWPVGLLLGVALQVANALPDLEEDAAHGVRGTAQRLGRRAALAVAWGGYLAAVLLALGLGFVLGSDRRVLLPGGAAALALLVPAVGAYARRPGAPALQLGWSVLAPGAGVLAVAWLAALPAT
jgi:4-hydroxybenzoate polyprenyltransferase